jgi:hypothetical protein
MKKILLSLCLVFLFTGFSFSQKNKNSFIEQYRNISYKVIYNGDAISAICNNKSLPGVKTIMENRVQHNRKAPVVYNTAFTFTGCSTIYDVFSNGTAANITQDPNNPDRIHLVCMYSPPGDGTAFPNRRTKYYYSTNRGTSFSFVAEVPAGIRSGYPTVTLAPNGVEFIANHNTNVSVVQCSHFYYDAAAGLGSFTELYKTQFMDYIWPRVVFTNSLANTNKFIAIQAPNGRDSCFWDICTSLNPAPGVFSSWNFIYSDQGEAYDIARGSDGRIGILYHNNDALLPNDYGDLYFMESTNNGSSFDMPLKIFDANVSPSGDSLGSFKGMQLVYQGSVPKVIFETIKQTTANSFYSNAADNRIRFWSSSLPGSNPNKSITIATTDMVGNNYYINSSTTDNDGLTNICRPTIGVSQDGTALFVAFMAPSAYYGGSVDTVSYNNIWIMHSTNNGSNWSTPALVNDTLQLKDWTYPSISPVNDNSSTTYYVNLALQSDTLPGSYVNFSNNGESYAKIMFARVQIPRSTGIANIGSEIPNTYKLHQNFPNPFNPVTKIRFDLPKMSGVKLKVFDLLGKEIATLVNEKLPPGKYETEFSIDNVKSTISSGIYFYKLETENFTAVKKLVLIK